MKSLIFGAFCLFFVADARNPSGYVAENIGDPVAYYAQHLQMSRGRDINTTNIMETIQEKMAMCWKVSQGRGIGRPIHSCPEGMEKDAGLCYKYCKEGYDGVGPVCWEQCKPGYTDTGAFCSKGGKIISANNDACPWYDICGLTFEKGCSFCPPNDPPYKNDGCTCRIDPHTYAKDSYGRGVGKPMGCDADEEYDAGLCYDLCPAGFEGVGPVCWQTCPRSRPEDYGAVCCKSEEDCKNFIKEVSKAATQFVAAAVQAGRDEGEVKDAIKKAFEAAKGFALFSCDRFTYKPPTKPTLKPGPTSGVTSKPGPTPKPGSTSKADATVKPIEGTINPIRPGK